MRNTYAQRRPARLKDLSVLPEYGVVGQFARIQVYSWQ